MKCFDHFDAVVFDLDGTLCDTAADILGAWVGTARKLKLASPEESRKRYRVGPPLTELLEELVPGCSEEFKKEAVATFAGIYDRSGFPETRLYPGIVELLDTLKAAGKKLFVATNKRKVPTLLILEKLDLAKYFRKIYTLDSTDGAKNKNEMVARLLAEQCLAPGTSAMVGDTAGDIRAAKVNAMTGVGVSWGYGARAELEDAGADAMLELADIRGASRA